MALLRTSTAERNQAATEILWTDTTGNYDAANNPGGYGAPNAAVANNVFTRFDFILGDGSTARIDVDAATLPTTDFVPKNGLITIFTPARLALTETEFQTGVISILSKSYFTTASGGNLTFTNGSATVAAASGQNLTIDYADTSMVLFNGIEYTIAAGSLLSGQFTLASGVFTGATLTAVGYRGYATTTGAVIDREFEECLMPKYIANRSGTTCDKSFYSEMIKLRYQWDAVYAIAQVNITEANTFLQDITRNCTCLNYPSTISGCASCL